MPNIFRFAETSALASAAAEMVAKALHTTLTEKRSAVLALPGGSTARLVLPELARKPAAWQQLQVTLVDERWVPPSHSNSNAALVRSLLLRQADTEFIELYMDAVDVTAAVSALATRVPAPDVVLLGMGEDGHIASLFPYDPANIAPGLFAAVSRPDYPRITMTPTALLQARQLILVFSGQAKCAVFDRALQPGPTAEFPVRHILERASVLIGP